MSAKPTLGTWTVRLNNPLAITPGHTINQDNDAKTPVGIALHYPGRPEVGIAHAYAMTAAPELLEAAELAEMALCDIEAAKRKGYLQSALKSLRAAITKAKGGG